MHRAETGLFVGYGKSSKIRRIYIPERNVIVESRDVTFKPYQSAEPKSTIELITQQDPFVPTLKTSLSAAESRSYSIHSEVTNESGENEHNGPGEQLNSPSRIPIASPANGRRQRPRPSNQNPNPATKPPVITRSGRTVKARERYDHSATTTKTFEMLLDQSGCSRSNTIQTAELPDTRHDWSPKDSRRYQELTLIKHILRLHDMTALGSLFA